MGSLFSTESNESAAVKRQAEGFSNPMYRMLDLGVGPSALHSLSRVVDSSLSYQRKQ